MSGKCKKYYGVLTYVTDPIREPGRARLIWAAKTADAAAQVIGNQSVRLVSSLSIWGGLKALLTGTLVQNINADYKQFYQIEGSLRVQFVPCLGARLKWFKSAFQLERCVGLFFFKHTVLPKLNVLHTRDYEAARLAISKGVRVIYEDHDEDFHRSVDFDRDFLSSEFLLEVVAITRAVRERLLASGVPDSKIVVRGSGVGRKQVVDPSVAKKSSKEQFAAVYCGGLHENRGIGYILELAKAFPADEFVIIGGRNAHVRAWKSKCSCDNITFEGYLDQVRADQIQESANCLLLPYKDSELAKITSPLKFFSYLAKARPIVSARMPELGSYFDDDLAVEWCDVGDYKSFEQAYRRLRIKDWDYRQLKANANAALKQTWEVRQAGIFERHALLVGDKGLYSEDFSGREYDWVFAMNRSAKGWVLETICAQIAAQVSGTSRFVYTDSNRKYTDGLPRARRYWFAHFNQLVAALRKESHVSDSELYVWFTHFKETGISDRKLVESLNQCNLVFCTCSEVADGLKRLGVREDLLRCYIGGAHPEKFELSQRLGKTVGISAGYYPRKNPELMLDVVRDMSDVNFILVGPSPTEISNTGILWSNWERYSEMSALPNLEMVEALYEDYPKYYARMDVFLSVSKKEGGPIPLLEAMMANVYPVVSHTGFAPDVIHSDAHGLMFDLNSGFEVADVVALIRKGLNSSSDVRSYALNFSWDSFAAQILEDVEKNSFEIVG